MKQPNFYQENKLRKRGFRFIAGLDEAGRGAWAGPIVAGAVIIEVDKVNKVDRVNGVLKGVKDSKLLTPKKREKFFEIIIRQVLDWSVGVVSEKVIDEIGIVKANKLAMKKALENLSFKPDYVLIDGKINLDKLRIPSQSIIQGDTKIFSIASASIIAKVWRDRIMIKLHEKYPYYGFAQHKGYGTKLHWKTIQKYKICPLHRKTFKPMKLM